MRRVTWMGLFALIGSMAAAQERNARDLVAAANGLFADGEYAAALEMYTVAGAMLSEPPELAYNQGVAHYKLGNYEQARDAFNRSLSTRNAALEAKIKFNLGNVAYATARRATADPPAAIALLKSAIGHYRDAVELNSEDQDACVNIELAQRLIEDLLERLKQRPEETRRDSDQTQSQGEDDEKPQPSGQGDDQREDDAPQQQEALQPQVGDRMTLQERRQLLQAVRDKEQARRRQLAGRQRVRRMPVTRDW